MNILSVGGFDPSGGAGIIADVKTIKELNKNPISIISSIIPQNNNKVYLKRDLPKKEIKSQFEAVFEDFNIEYVKTGVMTRECIDVLLNFLKEYDLKIICDPVLKSTTNFEFVDSKLFKKYVKFFEKCYLITPNAGEFEILKRFPENGLKLNLDKLNILITGQTDVLKVNNIENKKGAKETKIPGEYVKKEVHGTGCVYSSAITCFLSERNSFEESIKKAKEFVLGSVIYAEKTKYGYSSNPVWINKDSVEKSVLNAVNLIKKMDFSLIPEVGSNIAESTLLPKSYLDVCAISGKIIKNRLGGHSIVGNVHFGASKHLSRIILSAKEFNPKIRACMNIKYDKPLLKYLKENHASEFKISSFNRKDELKNISMELEITEAFQKYLMKIPYENHFDTSLDIIYDLGENGNEPMIRILGQNSLEIVEKLLKIEKISKNL
ncbi:Phosphomethylpyrimidine kinase [Methanococcus vannielii SB]|uniref:Phosphomethylpyrimidine kinase n=1 Tax=Methanococcus vannielii (strain ATCC 35089 / DSM 1224 / JCM 13029 / OCM 148 / SB) TaxID=406327 RepID=A6UQS5_METVS|nr:bifunctional hydroxymethylpyrimidine kinase/phosphomethylpyrimidine kinase [Methanococcus vannielii]ABR54847.1 Phosphomethylpyrimidine kinase [Methanococcus vannielii SB]